MRQAAVIGFAILILAACGGFEGFGPDTIAVVGEGDDRVSRIYVVNADRGKKVASFSFPSRQLSSKLDFDQNDPAWSPDGRKIVFANGDLYVVDVEDGTVRQLFVGRWGDERDTLVAYDPAWSPDGRRIAFARHRRSGDIYVVNVDGTGLKPLTTDRRAEFGPAWSPDGKEIAFTRLNATDSISDNAKGDIYVRSLAGGVERRLTGKATDDREPAWSPDGTRIAYENASNFGDEIMVMDANGSHARNLTNTNDDWEFSPAWSPDGKRLAFIRDTATAVARRGLYVMNADGSGQRQLTEGSGYKTPAWRSTHGRG